MDLEILERDRWLCETVIGNICNGEIVANLEAFQKKLEGQQKKRKTFQELDKDPLVED